MLRRTLLPPGRQAGPDVVVVPGLHVEAVALTRLKV
jgi:hypothetical protein